MPILETIRKSITQLLFKHILADYEDDKQINQLLQTKILPQTSTAIDDGTFGSIFLNNKTVYKIMILKSKINSNNLNNIINNSMEIRNAFKREYGVHQLVSQIKNYTCNIYEFKTYGPICYLTMQYLENYVTLKDYMSMKQVYTEENNNVICTLIKQRLNELQKLQIYHGDIKLTNIMVKLDKKNKCKRQIVDLKFIDFGKSYTYNDLKELAEKEYKRYHLEKNYYERWKMLQKRKLIFHQNFHYSSILQYTFNELLYKDYYKICPLLDEHSAGLTILHLYNGEYINDFPRASYQDNFQKFIAYYIILFGPEIIIEIIKLANAHSKQQNNSTLNQTEESEYSYSSFEEDESMEEYQNFMAENAEITDQKCYQIPDAIKQYISIKNNKFYVSKAIKLQIQQIKHEHTVDYYLSKILDQECQNIVKQLIQTLQQLKSLLSSPK